MVLDISAGLGHHMCKPHKAMAPGGVRQWSMGKKQPSPYLFAIKEGLNLEGIGRRLPTGETSDADKMNVSVKY